MNPFVPWRQLSKKRIFALDKAAEAGKVICSARELENLITEVMNYRYGLGQVADAQTEFSRLLRQGKRGLR